MKLFTQIKNTNDAIYIGIYVGKTPKRAACKALTGIIKKIKNDEFDSNNISIKFGVRETTIGSMNKIYYYSGERHILDSPIMLNVNDRQVLYKYRNTVKYITENEYLGKPPDVLYNMDNSDDDFDYIPDTCHQLD